MGIGDGCHTSLWYHHWVGDCPIYQIIQGQVPEYIAYWRVTDIIHNNSWFLNDIIHLLPPSLIPQIEAILIPSTNETIEDRLRWSFTKNGVFTIKSAYHHADRIAVPHSPHSSLLSSLWKINAPFKYKMLLWNACHTILPVGTINLVRLIIQDQLQRWRPPQPGFFKLNTDGSWRDIASVGGGGVIRVEDGGWVTGFSTSYHACTPLDAELLALKKRLQMAWDHNIKKLEVEVDAKELLNLLNSGLDQPHHDLFVLIHEVSLMLKWDWLVILNHVHRESNQVAHLLAYLLFYMEQDLKVYHESPQYVQAAFRKDMRNVPSTSAANV
ncbi:hypothetical protein RDABS01_023347 [Bienertia sinuspersici]